MKKKVILYAAALIVLGGLAAWVYLVPTEPVTPESLVEKALQAEDLSDRVQAASRLMALKDPNPIPYLRQLLALSQDPQVLTQAIDGLAVNLDHESVPLFIGTLNHSELRVRQAGYVALLRLYGGELPNKIPYKPDASAAERAKTASKLLKLQEEQKKLPQPKT